MDGTSIGLSRKHSYAIGAALIVIALSMGIPCGDDLLVNLPLGTAISHLTGIDLITSLIITYTIIPVTLFLFGVWIYPGSTINNIKKRIHKASKVSHRLIKNPFVWLLALGVIFLLWQYYTDGGSSIISALAANA